MKKNSLLLILSIILGLSLVLAACQPSATQAPAAEQPQAEAPAEEAPAEEAPAAEAEQPAEEAPTEPPAEKALLVYAISAEPETLFPGYEATAIASYGFELIFNNLTTKDLQGNNVGDLAESWEVSDDQLTWTFYLVDNASWHDGTPFTARDVAYTFELLADQAYTGTYYTMIESIVGAREKHDGEAESVAGINIIDDHTIAITTTQPNALILETMSSVMPILPAHILEEIPVTDLANSDFARQPVGTGPFMLRQWKTEESLIFDKNPTYFDGPANIDTFIWQIIPEPSAQITALLNGEIDLINVNADDFPQVENVAGVATKSTPGSRFINVTMHHTDPFLADVRTRQAIAHAIDREALLIGIYGGQGSVESCIFHPSLPEYDPTLTGFEYDPEKARQLLAEVGWVDLDGDSILEAQGVSGIEDGTKFVIEIGTRSVTLYIRYNEMLQQYLKEVGIDSTINSMEAGIYFGEYFIMGGPWQLSGSAWSNLIGSPQQELLWNITCDSNSQYDYCNPELDEMIYANNTIFDDEERAANFHAILRILQDEAFYLAMMRPLDLYAYDDNLVISDYQSTTDLYRSIPTWSWK